jgi:hypothetical protein
MNPISYIGTYNRTIANGNLSCGVSANPGQPRQVRGTYSSGSTITTIGTLGNSPYMYSGINAGTWNWYAGAYETGNKTNSVFGLGLPPVNLPYGWGTFGLNVNGIITGSKIINGYIGVFYGNPKGQLNLGIGQPILEFGTPPVGPREITIHGRFNY